MTAWSEQQRAIFQWFADPPPDGNLVVRARAGTGKTTTIVEALKHINWKIGAGERALVCAFNKRIAKELNERLARIQKTEAKTLHALGFAFLRAAWSQAIKPDDKIERERIEEAIAAVGRRPWVWECITGCVKLMGFAKNADPFITVDQLEELASARGLDHADPGGFSADWMARVVRKAMDASLAQRLDNRISYDDMIFVPAALKLGQPLYEWVLVDEAQDMSAAQLILAQSAVKPGGHIVVVGDDRQAIYSFRGADSGCIDRLKAELHADELGLTTTYRCPRSIVDAAKKLVGDFACPEGAADGQVIAGTRADVLEKAQPGDVILSRTNAPLVPLCLAFVRKNVPARIEGRDIGKMLIERAKAKSLRSETVEEFLTKLTAWYEKANARALSSGKNVETKLQNTEDVYETLHALAEDCETMEDFYTRCEELFADVSFNPTTGQNEAKSFVVLSTVHKAKGLEWPRVFVLAHTLYCNGARRDDPEEENIHYVAITRSQSALMMVGGDHVARRNEEAPTSFE